MRRGRRAFTTPDGKTATRRIAFPLNLFAQKRYGQGKVGASGHLMFFRRHTVQRFGFLILLLLAALAAGAPSAMAQPRVEDVRTGQHGERTRFVLELSEKVEYRLFTLADPYRVVIDLPEVDWQAANGMRRPAGHVKTFRHGLFRPGNTRIVLDLAGPASVAKDFLLPPGHGRPWRFVLDLTPTSRAAFMKGAGAPKDMAPPRAVVEDVPGAGLGGGKPLVVLDPGHGGVDPGAIGVSGIHEKVITLAMGRQLAEALRKSGRYRVALTRDKDIFLPLRRRIAIARELEADLFISLHADAHPKRSVRGLSVYTLSETASDKEAARLARNENKADLIAGMDLSHESSEVANILLDLAQRETMNMSAIFANHVVDEASRETKTLGRAHRFAGFAVLKAPDVPSVLVELGYLSNAQEERLLRDRSYRARLANALVRSVDRYFAEVEEARRP